MVRLVCSIETLILLAHFQCYSLQSIAQQPAHLQWSHFANFVFLLFSVHRQLQGPLNLRQWQLKALQLKARHLFLAVFVPGSMLKYAIKSSFRTELQGLFVFTGSANWTMSSPMALFDPINLERGWSSAAFFLASFILIVW